MPNTHGNGPRNVPGASPPIPYRDNARGPSIITNDGQFFYFEEPEKYEYSYPVIGHALANICRFAGQGGWWSVGQHSILVAQLALPKDTLRALLHDASEAFMVDVPGPLKSMPFMDGYRELEARVTRAIHKQFGIPKDEEAERRVKEIDLAVRPAEAHMIGIGYGEDNGHVEIPRWIVKLGRNMVADEFVRQAKWCSEQ